MKLSVKFYRRAIISVFCVVLALSLVTNIVLAFLIRNKSIQPTSAVLDSATTTNEKTNDLDESEKDSFQTDGSKEPPKDEQLQNPGDNSQGCDNSYKGLYPELTVKKVNPRDQAIVDNTIYLTFDDGPCKYTNTVLDILAAHNVKATFFLVGNNIDDYKDVVKRMYNEGHSIGIHCNDHSYEKIYSSVKDYLDDFHEVSEKIKSVTGNSSAIVRCPGGSVNSYNREIYPQIIAELLRRGYVYYDWNVSSGDAGGKITSEKTISNVLSGVNSTERSIVLMHDIKENTVDALDDMLTQLEKTGKKFDVLTPNVTPMFFPYQ